MREMKDSGIEWIGEIPQEWNIARLRDIKAEKKYAIVDGPFGSAISTNDYKESGIPLIRITNLKNGEVTENDMVYISEELAEKVGRSSIGLSDIVFAKTGATIGKCGVNKTIKYGILASSCVKISISHDFDHRFFYYVFLTDQFNEALKNTCTGTTRDTINLSPFSKLNVVIPPYKIQHRIADYLDRKCSQIDAIIARQQEVIEKLKAYKLSVITEAVTKGLNPDVPMKDSGVEWTGQIPEHWDIHKFCWDYSAMLGKMLDAKRITGKRLRPYIKNVDVQWDNINFENLDEMDFLDEEKERYTICPGDLMVCEGGEIGKCAIVPDNIPEGIYYQKALHRVRKRYPDSGNVYFLSKVIYCMAKNNCLNTSPEKATIAHLPGDALSQLKIPTPPISEQDQIAQYLNEKCREIDRISARKQETIDKLIEYKKSLIYEVVTGKKEV